MIQLTKDLIGSFVEALLDMVDSVAQLDSRIYAAVAVVVALVNFVALWVL